MGKPQVLWKIGVLFILAMKDEPIRVPLWRTVCHKNNALDNERHIERIDDDDDNNG